MEELPAFKRRCVISTRAKWAAVSCVVVVLGVIALPAGACRTDGGPDVYVGSCKPPAGFRVVRSRTTRVEGQVIRATTWKWNEEAKALRPVRTQIIAIPAGKKAVNAVEEYATREVAGKRETIRFSKIACPDAKTLRRSITDMQQSFAVPHVELDRPLVGQRTWVSKSPNSDSLVIMCTSGLTLIRVYVTSPKLNAEKLRTLAVKIIKDTLAPKPQ